MTWGFIWLMFVLKIPIFALMYIVWWAVRAEPETASEGSGGSGDRSHPHRNGPRRPRRPRGPHSGAIAQAPPRMRIGTTRVRTFDS